MEAEDREGTVVINGVGRVSHGSLEEIFRLEAIANLFLEDVEIGGERIRSREEEEEEEKWNHLAN